VLAEHNSRRVVHEIFVGGVVAVLVLLWMLGFAIHVDGALIHLLLVVALVVVIVRLVSGRGP